MRKWKIAGYKTVSYVKKNGTPVNGTELYLISDPVTPDITGVETKVLYISNRIPFVPEIGIEIHVYYDERGYVEAIVPAA